MADDDDDDDVDDDVIGECEVAPCDDETDNDNADDDDDDDEDDETHFVEFISIISPPWISNTRNKWEQKGLIQRTGLPKTQRGSNGVE